MGLTLILGCSGPRVESKKDPAYAGYKLKRVLVIYYNEEAITQVLGKGFGDEFLARLTGLLRQKGVASEVIRPKQNDVEGQERLREVAGQFRALQVMHIQLAQISSQGGVWRPTIESLPTFSHDVSVTFELRLEDPFVKKTFWEGRTTILAPGNANKLVEGVVQKLASEGFL